MTGKQSGNSGGNGKHKKNGRRPEEHLKQHQWKKGQSGNPSGRPKGSRSVVAFIRRLLNEGIEDKDIVKALAETGIKQALKGDFRYWKEIIDRIDGKVPDKLQTDVSGEIEINVKVPGEEQ